MTKYRRIEVNAYRRRVTIVSGEWPREPFDAPPAQADDGVSLANSAACEPIEPDSPEGQQILVEAVRTLVQRLTPETRETIRIAQDTVAANPSNGSGFFRRLQSFYQFTWPQAFRFARKEK